MKLKSFRAGKIFNILQKKEYTNTNNKPIMGGVVIDYPSRLNAMAMDPSRIDFNANHKYNSGEVIFTINEYIRIIARIDNSQAENIIISETSERKSLIKHAYLLMKKALLFKDKFYIDVQNQGELKHVGLGSSSRLISAVAYAINEIYNRPISAQGLVIYLAQNHGEEILNDSENLMPVQCLGGSAAAGIIGGGLIIIAGNSQVIGTMNISSKYSVIIGVPKDFNDIDSETAILKEQKNIQGFIDCGNKYGPTIAYRILHEALPAMKIQDLKSIGNIIYDYRFNMGSIKNCSFLYPKIIAISKRLAALKTKGIADVLSISSVGPSIFAITTNADKCIKEFEKEDLIIYTRKIHNDGCKLVSIINENKFWNDPDVTNLFYNKKPCIHVESEIKDFKLKPNMRALDLGCGGGRHLEVLLNKGFETYGTDLNDKMIEKCVEILKKYYPPNKIKEHLKKANITKIPFPNEYFDCIITTGVLHQAKSLKEYETAIKEISRIIKKNGTLITNIFSSKIKDTSYIYLDKHTVITKEGLFMTLISKEEYINIMKKNGFKIEHKILEEIKDIETGPRCVLRAVFIKC